MAFNLIAKIVGCDTSQRLERLNPDICPPDIVSPNGEPWLRRDLHTYPGRLFAVLGDL